MGFTGTVPRTGPTDARCRCVALRVTFGLRASDTTHRRSRWTRAFGGDVFPAHSRDRRLTDRLLAPVPHPVRTL